MNEMTSVPMGLRFSLEKHPSALENFRQMEPGRRQEVIQKAREASCREEMRALVENLL